MAAGAKHSAVKLKSFEDEAQLAGLSWPRLTPALCQELAKAVDDPLAWTTEFLGTGCPDDLVRPFAEKTEGTDRGCALHLLRDYADNLEYRHLFVGIVLTTQDASECFVDTVISMASAWPQLLQGLAWDGEVPHSTLKRLLTCNYPNVAFEVAIKVWNSKERELLISTLGQDWEQAVVAGLRGSPVGDNVEYWLKDILETRPDLAEKCLSVFFETDDDTVLPYAAIQIARKATESLTVQQKRALIDHATGKAFSTGDIITALVGDDPDIYAHLLSTECLQKFHLEPFSSLPQSHWAEFIALAADTGFATDEIIQASGPKSRSWQGSESAMWYSRQEVYEKFVDHADDSVSEVARQLSDQMRDRAEYAAKREREEKIWGL